MIPGVNSIAVPNNVPGSVPRLSGHDALRLVAVAALAVVPARRRSTITPLDNDLVQQATLALHRRDLGFQLFELVLGNQFTFSPTWLGSFTFDASDLHHTETRNSNLGFALAFPFSSTSSTISGFETFGDNQFVTPITAFPVLRNQEKYQFRYDVSHASGRHAPRFGIDFIHEPVLSGALSGTAENLTVFAMDPGRLPRRPSTVFRSI